MVTLPLNVFKVKLNERFTPQSNSERWAKALELTPHKWIKNNGKICSNLCILVELHSNEGRIHIEVASFVVCSLGFAMPYCNKMRSL